MQRVVMVTGLQASGKSPVGPMLAARLRPPAVTFDGDVLHRMVVAGRDNMTSAPSPEALRQLSLRYQGAGMLAQHYADNGFDFVHNDVVLGSFVSRWMASITGAERHLIVLAPSVDAIVEREMARGGNSYRDWQRPDDALDDAVRLLTVGLEEIPKRGLWLDTSGDTPSRPSSASWPTTCAHPLTD